MKVINRQRVRWNTDRVLHPEDLNVLYQYARDVVRDVGQRRFTKGLALMQFVTDVGTPYTNATPTETLTFRFTCPVTCVVERAFLNANMTSSADVQFTFTTSAGATPTGCINPLLSTGAAVASAATETLDINVDKFVLTAGQEYKLVCSSTAAFSLERCDVVLHIATDRWTTAGTAAIPDFVPTSFTQANFRDAALVAANNTALTTEAAKFAANVIAPAPLSYVRHAFDSTTDADLLRFPLPTYTRANCVVRRIYLYVSMATTGGTTVTVAMQNAAGAAVRTVTANVAGLTQVSADSGALTDLLLGSPATTTDDYRIVFANASAAVSCLKAQALIWLSR